MVSIFSGQKKSAKVELTTADAGRDVEQWLLDTVHVQQWRGELPGPRGGGGGLGNPARDISPGVARFRSRDITGLSVQHPFPVLLTKATIPS